MTVHQSLKLNTFRALIKRLNKHINLGQPIVARKSLPAPWRVTPSRCIKGCARNGGQRGSRRPGDQDLRHVVRVRAFHGKKDDDGAFVQRPGRAASPNSARAGASIGAVAQAPLRALR